jgi:AcrR family transcriptional regulator
MSSLPQARPPRADAQRNRSHILDIAGVAFGEEGIDVSMDSIAKRAGVGPGTLYRHFPTRDALLAALLEKQYEHLEHIRAAIQEDEPEPAAALQRWIGALGQWMNAYEGLPEPLRAAWSQPSSVLMPTCQSLVDASDRFLSAAQQDGSAKSTLTGRDIFLAAMAIAWASSTKNADGNAVISLQEMLRTGWVTRPQ